MKTGDDTMEIQYNQRDAAPMVLLRMVRETGGRL